MHNGEGGGFIVEEEGGYDEPPPGCRECGCLSFDHEYWQAYKVMVCVHCKKMDKYRQVPKGQVKDIFLLTDGDLKHLGFVSRPNPQHKRWSDMRLYLQMQVEEVALRKYGDVEAIRDARQARLQARIADRAAKRKLYSSQGLSGAQEGGGIGEGGGFLPEQDPDASGGMLNPRVADARARVRQRLMLEYGAGEVDDEPLGHASVVSQRGVSRVKKEVKKEAKSEGGAPGRLATRPAVATSQQEHKPLAAGMSQVVADTEEI